MSHRSVSITELLGSIMVAYQNPISNHLVCVYNISKCIRPMLHACAQQQPQSIHHITKHHYKHINAPLYTAIPQLPDDLAGFGFLGAFCGFGLAGLEGGTILGLGLGLGLGSGSTGGGGDGAGGGSTGSTVQGNDQHKLSLVYYQSIYIYACTFYWPLFMLFNMVAKINICILQVQICHIHYTIGCY